MNFEWGCHHRYFDVFQIYFYCAKIVTSNRKCLTMNYNMFIVSFCDCLGKCMYLLQWNIQCKQNFYVVTRWIHIFSKVPTRGQLAIGTNRVPICFSLPKIINYIFFKWYYKYVQYLLCRIQVIKMFGHKNVLQILLPYTVWSRSCKCLFKWIWP